MNDITREELNARLETIETRMDGRLSSMGQMIVTKFAEFESTLHKSNADTVKWVAGIVLAVGAAGLALMTFLINNITPRPVAVPFPSSLRCRALCRSPHLRRRSTSPRSWKTVRLTEDDRQVAEVTREAVIEEGIH